VGDALEGIFPCRESQGVVPAARLPVALVAKPGALSVPGAGRCQRHTDEILVHFRGVGFLALGDEGV